MEKVNETPWYFYLFFAILLCFSGFFSGTNIGVMSLDEQQLKALSKGPFLTKEDEQKGI